ncbi:uncharacterized protein BP5553_03455 [Venustampulla echinocandica]|uniref:VOC domain-containing protein n=1 Tax=Venustampulla echinocandica TaxID=2656787 RepID=A0A370TUA8_9HELO|nr:uncharacterized protein BP5553_03455 [Venustampulla echinocandica]RDL39115.1 hypothetical protein BP5553_03455 [Venustampulla echinocandica]
MSLAHVSLPVSSLETSKSFYLETLKSLGYGIWRELDQCIGFGVKNKGPDFWIHGCSKTSKVVEDVKEAGDSKGDREKIHIAFNGNDPDDVRAFYEAALKAGGTCNSPPADRSEIVKGYYAAFVLDPDGNKIECMSYQP